MTIERDQGRLICRECDRTWVTDEATAMLLEQLVAHSLTHMPPEQADTAKPEIWLR